jgi:hypothetical protein
MRTHVLPQCSTWPLAKIDQLAVQTWITGLSARLSPVRSRVWRPSLVRAGLLGSVTPHGGYLPQWTDQAGKRHREHVDDEGADMKWACCASTTCAAPTPRAWWTTASRRPWCSA